MPHESPLPCTPAHRTASAAAGSARPTRAVGCPAPPAAARAPDGRGRSNMAKLTVPAVRARKASRDGSPPLVMVTAYDAPGARTADAAGVDLLLVGDSVAMVVLGHDDTLSV